MLYPSNSTDKLGFTEVKELIKAHCLSEMGRQMVDRIQVMNNYDQIRKFLYQASEFKNILENDEALPIHHFFDIKSLANKARIEGAFLSEEEFYQVQASLTTVFAVIGYFNEREGQYPNLEALFEHLPIEKAILRKIEKRFLSTCLLRKQFSGKLTQLLTRRERSDLMPPAICWKLPLALPKQNRKPVKK